MRTVRSSYLCLDNYTANFVMFMILSTGSGSGFGGRGMHNGCDFGTRKER